MSVLEAFGIQADNDEIMLSANLLLSFALIQKAIPDTLPFLFKEAADSMAEIHINNLVEVLEKMRNS